MKRNRRTLTIWTLAGFLLPAGALVYLFLWALVGERLSPRTEINRAAILMEQRAHEELRLKKDGTIAAIERWFDKSPVSDDSSIAPERPIPGGRPFGFDVHTDTNDAIEVLFHRPVPAVERRVLDFVGSQAERDLYNALRDDFERREFIEKDGAGAEQVLDSMGAERFSAPPFALRTMLARAAFLKRHGRFGEIRSQLVDVALNSDLADAPSDDDLPFVLQAYLMIEAKGEGDPALDAVRARILPAMEKGALPLSSSELRAVAARLVSLPPTLRQSLLKRAGAVELAGIIEGNFQLLRTMRRLGRFAFASDGLLWMGACTGSDVRGFAIDAEGGLARLIDRKALEDEIDGLSVVLEPESAERTDRATSETLRTQTAPAGIEGARLRVLLVDRTPFEQSVDTRRVYVFGVGGSLLLALLVLGFATFRAVRREVAAARARSEFMASVSHELRTPLASIRTFAELLEENRVSDDATRHRFTRLIVSNCRRLSAMIENVLDLRRSEEGGLRYAIDEVDLNALLTDLFRDIGAVAEEDGFTMTVDIAPELPPVRADAMALARAIYNLCDNARKYGGERKTIMIGAVADGARVRIAISDRGPGISLAERKRIFDRFQRGQGGMTAPSGVGLGLSLAREAIEACGGTLSVESTGSEGSTFLIDLPVVDEIHDE